MKITGYSKAQLGRHIAQYRNTGQVRIKEYELHKFQKKYTLQDIRLLAKTVELHFSTRGRSEENLRAYGRRIYQEEYRNIVGISASHIYNLKKKVS